MSYRRFALTRRIAQGPRALPADSGIGKMVRSINLGLIRQVFWTAHQCWEQPERPNLETLGCFAALELVGQMGMAPDLGHWGFGLGLAKSLCLFPQIRCRTWRFSGRCAIQTFDPCDPMLKWCGFHAFVTLSNCLRHCGYTRVKINAQCPNSQQQLLPASSFRLGVTLLPMEGQPGTASLQPGCMVLHGPV